MMGLAENPKAMRQTLSLDFLLRPLLVRFDRILPPKASKGSGSYNPSPQGTLVIHFLWTHP